MNHLVGHRIFEMTLVLHFIGTDQDTILGIEPSRFPIRTTAAVDVMAVQVASELLNVIAEESNDGTCTSMFKLGAPRRLDWKFRLTVLEEIVALVFASLAVSSFIPNISRNAELLDSLRRHLPSQD